MRTTLLMHCLVFAAGCKTAPPLADVLVAAESGVPQATLQGQVDAEARAARAAAESMPDSAAAQIKAARWLATSADVRLIEDQIARLTAGQLTVPELVELDEAGGRALKDAVLGLCAAGLEHGELAVELAPDDPAAVYYRAFHLSLVAWAEGKRTAILRGRAPALKTALESVAARFPEFQAAAPLRLRGRFLDRAPWPYGNREKAIELLETAARVAPSSVNWQFLGDALWVHGDEEAAAAAWGRGAAADERDPDDRVASMRRQLNQARVEAYGAGGQPQR